MLTIPPALWPYLLSKELRHVVVYEIEAFAGRSTLYYSDQNITWGGHDYVGLALSSTPAVASIEAVVPDCTAAANICRPSGLLKNSSRPLRDQTGKRPPPVEICCRFPSPG